MTLKVMATYFGLRVSIPSLGEILYPRFALIYHFRR